jgi:hypothetical protein
MNKKVLFSFFLRFCGVFEELCEWLCFMPKKLTAQTAYLVFSRHISQRRKNQKSSFFANAQIKIELDTANRYKIKI